MSILGRDIYKWETEFFVSPVEDWGWSEDRVLSKDTRVMVLDALQNNNIFYKDEAKKFLEIAEHYNTNEKREFLKRALEKYIKWSVPGDLDVISKDNTFSNLIVKVNVPYYNYINNNLTIDYNKGVIEGGLFGLYTVYEYCQKTYSILKFQQNNNNKITLEINIGDKKAVVVEFTKNVTNFVFAEGDNISITCKTKSDIMLNSVTFCHMILAKIVMMEF